MTSSWFIGNHKDCTRKGVKGQVFYYVTGSSGVRKCNLCGADGSYGRPNPDIEPTTAGEQKPQEL